MVLQLLYFQSSGWLEEVAGLGFPLGFIIIMLGYLVAARGLGLGYANPRLMHPLLAIGFGILLVITVFNANHLAGFAILTLANRPVFPRMGPSRDRVKQRARK